MNSWAKQSEPNSISDSLPRQNQQNWKNRKMSPHLTSLTPTRDGNRIRATLSDIAGIRLGLDDLQRVQGSHS